jgi:nucleoside-diphosphate-sugar epimerase
MHYCDIRDADSLTPLLRESEIIFCLAGQVSHVESMRDPKTDLDINLHSHLALLEACRRENREVKIVFASTRQLYGKPRYLPVDEHHPLQPVDANGISKSAAEMFFRLYHQRYGIRSVSLRLTNTYGPRMDLRNPHKGFVGTFLRKALRGERIQIFGTGRQVRDFNYIDDVTDAFLLAAAGDALDGETFNLGHPQPCSLREFVKVLRQFAAFEWECVPFPPERQAIDVGDYCGDFRKFQSATGWRPQVDLEQGLSETVNFFNQHFAHYC